MSQVVVQTNFQSVQQLAAALGLTAQQTTQLSDALGNLFTSTTKDAQTFGKAIDTVFRNYLINSGERAFRSFGRAAKESFTQARDTLVQFERDLATLQTVLEASAEDVKGLGVQAMVLADKFRKTTAEVNALQIELARLGFVTSEITLMTEAVIKFSKAMNDMDTSQAANLMGSVIQAYGKSAAEADNIADILVAAADKTAISGETLGTSLSQVMGTASLFGFKLSEVVTVLGLLANRGVDASIAATSLRRTMLRLNETGSEARKIIGGNVNTLEEVVRVFQEFSDAGKTANDMQEMFGDRGLIAASALLQGYGLVLPLFEEIEGGVGSMERRIEIFQSTTGSVLEGIATYWDDFVLRFVNSGGPITRYLEKFLGGLKGVGGFIQENLLDNETNVQFNRQEERQGSVKAAADSALATRDKYEEAYRSGGLTNLELKSIYEANVSSAKQNAKELKDKIAATPASEESKASFKQREKLVGIVRGDNVSPGEALDYYSSPYRNMIPTGLNTITTVGGGAVLKGAGATLKGAKALAGAGYKKAVDKAGKKITNTTIGAAGVAGAGASMYDMYDSINPEGGFGMPNTLAGTIQKAALVEPFSYSPSTQAFVDVGIARKGKEAEDIPRVVQQINEGAKQGLSNSEIASKIGPEGDKYTLETQLAETEAMQSVFEKELAVINRRLVEVGNTEGGLREPSDKDSENIDKLEKLVEQLKQKPNSAELKKEAVSVRGSLAGVNIGEGLDKYMDNIMKPYANQTDFTKDNGSAYYQAIGGAIGKESKAGKASGGDEKRLAQLEKLVSQYQEGGGQSQEIEKEIINLRAGVQSQVSAGIDQVIDAITAKYSSGTDFTKESGEPFYKAIGGVIQEKIGEASRLKAKTEKTTADTESLNSEISALLDVLKKDKDNAAAMSMLISKLGEAVNKGLEISPANKEVVDELLFGVMELDEKIKEFAEKAPELMIKAIAAAIREKEQARQKAIDAVEKEIDRLENVKITDAFGGVGALVGDIESMGRGLEGLIDTMNSADATPLEKVLAALRFISTLGSGIKSTTEDFNDLMSTFGDLAGKEGELDKLKKTLAELSGGGGEGEGKKDDKKDKKAEEIPMPDTSALTDVIKDTEQGVDALDKLGDAKTANVAKIVQANTQEAASDAAAFGPEAAKLTIDAGKSGMETGGWIGSAIAIAGVVAALIAGVVAAVGAFAEGGIVPGGSTSGDKLTARVNSGEMILNKKQQANLYARLHGKRGFGMAEQAKLFSELDSESIPAFASGGVAGELRAPVMSTVIGAGGQVQVSGEFRVAGRDLVAVLKNVERIKERS
jgi:TP901 family phage tail tape measure protein